MTKSNEINILRADHVVGLFQASIKINISFEILILGGHALPSINSTPIRNQNFQSSQIPILTADLESAETRPDTRQSSSGRLGRSRYAKTACNFKNISCQHTAQHGKV